MTTSTDARGRRASRPAHRLARLAAISAIAGLTAAVVVSAPAVAAPPPVPGAGTFTVVDVTEEDFDNDGTVDQTITVRDVLDRFGRAQSSVTENRRGDGTVSFSDTTTWEYDRQGRLVLLVTESDFFGDQVLDYRQRVVFEYDRSGQLVRITETTDEGADGIDVTTTTRTVTATRKAVVTNVTEIDWDDDGDPDERTVETTHYDQRGNTVLETKTVDLEADGTLEVDERRSWTYDKNLPLTELFESFLPSAESSLTTYSYDKKGRLTGFTETAQPSGTSVVTTLSFDSDGFFVGSSELTDFGGDGVVDLRVIETVEPDDGGRPLVRQVDTIGAGLPYRTTTTYVYEGDFIVSLTLTTDFGIDGEADQIEQQAAVVADGRVVEFTTTVDGQADGVIDYLSRTTMVYDDRGDVISAVTEVDQDGDGVIDSTTTQTRTIE